MLCKIVRLTSLVHLTVQNATSAIVATTYCCVCPPVPMMSNVPLATFDFSRDASLSKHFFLMTNDIHGAR